MVSDTLVKTATSAARHTDFAATFERHAAAWEDLWRVCDVQVSADEGVRELLRLHIAHVLQGEQTVFELSHNPGDHVYFRRVCRPEHISRK